MGAFLEFQAISKNKVKLPLIKIRFKNADGAFLCIANRAIFNEVHQQVDSDIFVHRPDRYSLLSFCTNGEPPEGMPGRPPFLNHREDSLESYLDRLSAPIVVELKEKPIPCSGPLLRGLVLDKATYKPGDSVTVRFRVSGFLAKPETNRLEFVEPLSAKDGFPGALSGSVYSLEFTPSGDYIAQFKIPGNMRPGRYVLRWFNRTSNLGCFEDRIGQDELETQVAEANPIVVE